MDYIGEKVIRLQDAKFKLHHNNNNETSIFISGPLAQNLGLVEGTTRKFFIEKFNLIKLLCFTFSFHKPLYKKEVVNLDLLWFDKYLSLINKHFEHSSEFSFDVRKQSQDRFYFISIEQSSGLNIRDLFIQDHVKIIFYSGEDNIIRIEFSDDTISDDIIVKTQENIEDTVVIEDSVIRQFALKSIKHMVNIYGDSFLSQNLRKISESSPELAVAHKGYLFPEYFKQSLFYSFEVEPEKMDSRTYPRFIDESLNILGEKFIYLTTEWAYSGKSNLLFSQLVNFIEDYSKGEYSAMRMQEDGPFCLIKKNKSINFILNDFEKHLKNTGLLFSGQIIQRFVASLCTKPFVILSGLSGSGKTKLAQAFAQWITESENQYKIIPVGADWTNREPLLGFSNGLDSRSYVTPDSGALQLLMEALKVENQRKPYFMILDEMNLSHVERYFADFLSIMESGEKLKLYSGEMRYSKIEEGNEPDEAYLIPTEIEWPKNLFIVGTVNIDETTYMFSPKVLDRANVIEFRISTDNMEKFFEEGGGLKMVELFVDGEKDKGGLGQNMGNDFLMAAQDRSVVKIPEIEGEKNVLNDFFAELQLVGCEFGYRSAYEIELLITKLGINEINSINESPISNNDKIDIAIMQKLLPKIHGSRKKLVGPLETLAGFCLERLESAPEVDTNNKLKTKYQQFISEKRNNAIWKVKYSISFEKIERMLKNVIESGFTSYAEA